MENIIQNIVIYFGEIKIVIIILKNAGKFIINMIHEYQWELFLSFINVYVQKKHTDVTDL